MPEIAAVYFTGLLACCALTILYVFLRRRRRHTEAALIVQANLRKIGLYWSDNRDAVLPWTTDTDGKEELKTQRAVGLTGLLLSLLSWAGVVFLLVIMLSERFFARSRRERRLFGSELARNASLQASEVQRLVDALDVCNASPAVAATTVSSRI